MFGGFPLQTPMFPPPLTIRAPRRPALPGCFELVCVLSPALYGDVVLVRHKRHGALRVVKQVAHDFIPPGMEDDPIRAKRLLAQLRDKCPHPHVMALAPANEQFGLHLTLPFAEGGDLMDWITGFDGTPAQRGTQGHVWMEGVMLGLHHLHTALRVAHNDVSPENIVITNGRAVLCDLGLARPLGGPVPRVSSRKRQYHAPEVCSRRQSACDTPSDVFSLGVVYFATVFGCLPFDAALDVEYTGIREGWLPEWLRTRGVAAPASFVALLVGMLRNDPTRRPSLPAALRALDELEWQQELMLAIRRSRSVGDAPPRSHQMT